MNLEVLNIREGARIAILRRRFHASRFRANQTNSYAAQREKDSRYRQSEAAALLRARTLSLYHSRESTGGRLPVREPFEHFSEATKAAAAGRGRNGSVRLCGNDGLTNRPNSTRGV